MLEDNYTYLNFFSQKIIYKDCILQNTELKSNLHDKVLRVIESGMPQLLFSLPYYDISHLYKIAREFESKFDTVLVIGMGGSILNSLAISDFCGLKSDVKIIFITKICEIQFLQIKSTLNLQRTGFILISNSGNTIETIVSADWWHNQLNEAAVQNLHEHFIFIYSNKSSQLHNLFAKIGGIYLEYDSKMGGRFATFTTPHILVMLLLRINIQSLFDGVNYAMNNFKNKKYIFDKILLFIVSNINILHNTNILIGNYDTRLNGLSKWYYTAIAETLGRDTTNITAIKLNLPLDQHGLMQAILTNNTHQKLHLFTIKENHLSKISIAQNIFQSTVVEQFYKQEIPIRCMTINQANEFTFAVVMVNLMLEIITTAVLLNTEPFVQPKIDQVKNNIAAIYQSNIN